MAQIKIRFINFDKSEALETFTKKQLEGLTRRLDRRAGEAKSIEVHFKLDAKAPLGSLKNSEVTISYRYPGIKKEIFVKKQGIDLRKVLLEAILTTENIIQKASEKSESGRRTLGKSKSSIRQMKQALTQ